MSNRKFLHRVSARSLASQAVASTAFIEIEYDSKGQPRAVKRGPSLLQRLLVRGGAVPAPLPVPAPKKRGRPSKGSK